MEQPPVTPSGRKTLLIVDDDPKTLEYVCAILEDHYDVLTAPNGEAACLVSRGSAMPIDLLLSDFQMPGMSGVQLATLLTADRPKIKVLLMSGFTDGMLVLNEGWHFLAKPFVSSQLRSLIVSLLFPDKSRFSGKN